MATAPPPVYDSSNDLAFLIELTAKAIDEVFGEGHAKAHPELVAAQLHAVAVHRLGERIAEAGGTIAMALHDIANS
ncbi:MAG: hypothetical protein VKO65_08265 [Cyanobacteriota bacterium]|nr:hypothetical protein [Cyanobacteriota bacterium]